MGSVLSRRTFLKGSAALGLAALLPSCRRHRAFSGYAFVANQEGRAIAAVDLGLFAVTRYIRLDGAPTAIVADPSRQTVYALTPDNGLVHEIRADRLALGRTLSIARSAVSMRLSADGQSIYVLCRDPQRLVAVSLKDFRVEWSVGLAGDPFDFDVAPTGSHAAVSYGKTGAIQLVDLAARRAAPAETIASETGTLRFLGTREKLENLLVADVSGQMLQALQVPSGRLITKLPLAVRPEHFCFNDDGGQLFITGAGMDAVVIVYPYYTPQIGETVLAGRSPGAMAASPTMLFVANSQSGDISIFNIDSRRMVGVAPAGTNPSFITITPDNEYALVLNQDSGDMAVLWIPALTRRHGRISPLFNMIPVGSKPVAAAVLPM
ncbi:MAG: twin-arginine translocation signal domain-containing protein [Bryobacteraceae bacterium]|jgi:DNA-binding beta-propeller fold protein YncE